MGARVRRTLGRFVTAGVTVALVAGSALAARADSALFIIRDLTFAGPTGQNGWPVPIFASEPGIDGHLLWTYAPGDFGNGTGTLQDLALPITYFPLGSAIVTVDATGITGAQPGNTHDLTYDFQLAFSPALSGPSAHARVDSTASTFDFTGYYQTFGGEWLGNITGGTIVPASEVLDAAPPVARGTALAAPAPNPSRGRATLAYRLARAGHVRLAIFGVDGRAVATLVDAERPAGANRAAWDGRDASGQAVRAGLYFARLETAAGGFTRALVRLD